jgi:hypothetical protein
MPKRTNDKGQALCQYGEWTDHPCNNVALWDVIVDGDPIGLSCEDCAHNGFNFSVKKSRVQLKSLATGRLITLAEALNVA